ncbi:hypothetical protein BGX27_008722 [Mortierella sp. AM989]|nr:hypothetical protein BGX27_008722 [Mortierella sp. AM989]
MDTAEHSSRSTTLRWRPYNNGNSLKAKKSKQDDSSLQEPQQHKYKLHHAQQKQQQLGQVANDIHSVNPKALAHKLRSSPTRTQPSPSTVQLQWEEAETVESMSHGGHPHTHQYYRHGHQNQRKSSLSDADSDSTIGSPTRHGSSSIPSLNLLGQSERYFSDLGMFKGSVPGLTGDDFLRHDLQLPKIEGNTCYQAALNALLENHRRNQILDTQAPALALTSVPIPMSATSPPAKLSGTSLTYPVSPLLSDGDNSFKRKLSTSELLGIVNIDDLLASCGYTDEQDNILAARAPRNVLTSPATTNKSSLRSSPVDSMMNLPNPEGSNSFTDISASYFDKLMAQTPVLLAEGDSKQLLQQQQQLHQQQHVDISPTLSTASTITNTFTEIISDLASPFVRFTSHKDPFISGDNPSSWPSLFPNTQEEMYTLDEASRERISMSASTGDTQSQSLSASSTRNLTQNSPLLMHLGFAQELDPEWLTFLDDSSPMVCNTDNEPGDGSLAPDLPRPLTLFNQADEPHPTATTATTTLPTSPPLRDGGFLGSWAKGVLQSNALSPTGHPSIGTRGSLGSGGSSPGSLIRSLQGGSYQKRSGYHTKTSTQRISSSVPPTTPKTKSLQRNSDTHPTAEQSVRSKSPPQPTTISNNITQSSKVDRKVSVTDAGEVVGLVALFRGLWKGGERGQ